MRIKPVSVAALSNAFNLALQTAGARTRSGIDADDEDGRRAYWIAIHKTLITTGFTTHEAARVMGLMFAIQDIGPVPTAQALARAASAPINPATFEFRNPASLFLSL